MKTKACRVTYQEKRYAIAADGTVRPTWVIEEHDTDGAARELPTTYKTRMYGDPVAADLAKVIRADAARQRRNKNSRDRHQAMTDLGLKRNRDGSYE